MSAMATPKCGSISGINRKLLAVSAAVVVLAFVLGMIAPVAAQYAQSESDLHVSMGIYYRSWGIGRASEDHFLSAWEKSNHDPEIAIVAAVAAYRDRDYGTALQWLKRIPDDFGQRAVALCLEGAIYLRQANMAYTAASGPRPETYYSAAEQRFTEALALQSDFAYAKHMLAFIYAARGESVKAGILLAEIPEADRIDAVTDMMKLLNQR
jgi:tetratricopeptide (TPR) repeat protein